MQGLIKSIGKLPGTVEYTELHSILFNPFSLYNSGNLDSVLEGAMQTNVEKSNRFFNKQVKYLLILKKNNRIILDGGI